MMTARSDETGHVVNKWAILAKTVKKILQEMWKESWIVGDWQSESLREENRVISKRDFFWRGGGGRRRRRRRKGEHKGQWLGPKTKGTKEKGQLLKIYFSEGSICIQ